MKRYAKQFNEAIRQLPYQHPEHRPKSLIRFCLNSIQIPRFNKCGLPSPNRAALLSSPLLFVPQTTAVRWRRRRQGPTSLHTPHIHWRHQQHDIHETLYRTHPNKTKVGYIRHLRA